MSNLTVKNPNNLNETYTFGTKGRKPNWLVEALENGTVKVPEDYIPKALALKNESRVATEQEIEGIKYWRYVGLNSEDDDFKSSVNVRCMAVADSAILAMKLLNETFKYNKVSEKEFTTCWKQIKPTDNSFEFIKSITTPGAYQFVNDAWELRKKVI